MPEAEVTTAKVTLSSGFSRRYTAGKREFEIAATTLRGVIRTLDELVSGARRTPRRGDPPSPSTEKSTTSPAISQKLKQGSEVFFIPKLEGG